MTKLTIGFRSDHDDLKNALKSLDSSLCTVLDLDTRDEPGFAHVWIIDSREPIRISDVDRKPFFTVYLWDKPGPERSQDSNVFLLSRKIFIQQTAFVIDLLRQILTLARETKILEREIKVLKTVETLYLTQEQDKAFSQLIFSVADILETEQTGTLFLRDPKKAAYNEYFPLEERRKGRRLKLTFHPEFLDEILFSADSYTIVDDPNSPDQKLIGLPIRSDQNGLGVIFVPVAVSGISEERFNVAAQFAMELSSVLENILLFMETKELTIKDDLTQAYNRRYFEAFVDEELERAKRYGSRFSIIFLDLDDLKHVNNKYGHLMGSRTLQEVSKRILQAVRHVDRVVRFGGDEFCVILPHTDPDEARNVAERIRQSINNAPFSLSPGIDVRISASFGVAGYPEHGKTKETLIAKADQAMFDIKSKAKDGVKLAENARES